MNESDSDISELSNIVLDGADYLIIDYEGPRERLKETYTWIIKYYLSNKGLKYDYRVQFHEYVNVPDLSKKAISCKINIPVCHT